MARVAALIPDLMFGSRVRAMIEGAGHDLELCSSVAEVRRRVPGSDLLIVDLTDQADERIEQVASLRATGELGPGAILAFYSHVESEVRARALAAGFDQVVPRSRMAREGEALVAGMLPSHRP